MLNKIFKGLTKDGIWITFKVPYNKTCRNLKNASQYANTEIIKIKPTHLISFNFKKQLTNNPFYAILQLR